MDSHKKGSRKDQPAASEKTAGAASPAKKLPIKTIHVDNVSCSIFAHEHARDGAATVNYSCGFSRNYKDRDGSSRHTPWFGLDELGTLVSCAEQAREYLTTLTAPAADTAA